MGKEIGIAPTASKKAKAMDEKTLLQVQAVINAKKDKLTYEDARALTERALEFKRERGRLPSLTSQDAWERKMAEGVAFLQRHAQSGVSGGFGGFWGCGGRGTLTVGTAARIGRGGRSCFGT